MQKKRLLHIDEVASDCGYNTDKNDIYVCNHRDNDEKYCMACSCPLYSFAEPSDFLECGYKEQEIDEDHVFTYYEI